MFVKLNTFATQQDLRLMQLSQQLNETSKHLEGKIEREAQRTGMLYNKLDNKINENFRKMSVSLTEVT